MATCAHPLVTLFRCSDVQRLVLGRDRRIVTILPVCDCADKQAGRISAALYTMIGTLTSRRPN